MSQEFPERKYFAQQKQKHPNLGILFIYIKKQILYFHSALQVGTS